MEEFATRENIHRWERALESETDPKRREVLEQLLMEERAHLQRLMAQSRRPK
jgi:hypothetical protein